MQRAHTYFLIIALLISILVHLFLINAAIEVSLKLGLFESTAAEDIFKIKTVERASPRVRQRTDLSHDDVVSLERPEDRGVRSEAEMADRREMLKLRGLVSEDASEAEINEALK